MKKYAILLGSMILILLLAACSGAAEESAPTAQTEEASLNEDYSDALPVASQLALGSLKLEETNLEISEAQATTLLPLWQAYQTLSNSDKAADAEIDALLKQIQNGMTDEQIEQIATMELTAEEVTAYMQEVGMGFGRGMFGGGDEGDENSAPGGGFPRGGGIPGAGGQPGGGFMGGGFGGDPAARETRLAEMGDDPEAMRAMFMNQAIVGSLVRSMQIKTGELDPDEAPLGRDRGLRTMEWVLGIVSESSGIPLETLQAETAEGSTLTEVIAAQSADLQAVETALTEAFNELPAASQIDIEERVSGLLNQSWVAEPTAE